MQASAKAFRPALGEELTARLLALYQAGRFLEAAELLPPKTDWGRLPSAADLILTGRVLNHAGAWQAGRALMLLARRREPRNLEAASYAAYSLPRKSLWDIWLWTQENIAWEHVTPETQAHWLTIKARAAAQLRDFAVAEAALAEADQLTPNHAWVASMRAEVLEAADEYERALEWTETALRLHPQHSPSRCRRAHLLTLLGRDDEALALLRESCASQTSCYYYFSLVNLLAELKQVDEALTVLDQMAPYARWVDAALRRWQSERRADLHSYRGELAPAIAHAIHSRNKYYAILRANLEQAPVDGRRVELPVPFVRQKHLNCVPATLCILARYWQRPIRQEEISAEICYDGTPHSAERGWAERHGWHTVEFTLTEAAARALIDRGVPFAFTTTFTESGHMQALVGYDTRRRTLIVRDPHHRLLSDWLAELTLQEHTAHGPRALIILPPEEVTRLNGLALPDAELWNHLYRLRAHLLKHEQEAARARLAALEQAAPAHDLTLHARLAIADYDRQSQQALNLMSQLLERHPKDGHFRLRKVYLLRHLNQRRQARELLESYLQDQGSHPVWLLQLAEDYLLDYRQISAMRDLRRRLLRLNPGSPDSYVIAARESWVLLEPDESVQLQRAAACLGYLREDLAAQYHRVASIRRKAVQAMDFLTQRDERLRPQSRAPLLTRFRALQESSQPQKARELLMLALATYPEDGQVLLQAAEWAAQRGEFLAARQHLEKARGRVPPIQWLQLSATLCEIQGDLAGSITAVRTALEQSPDNEGLLRQLLGLVSRRDTVDTAAALAAEWVARFPSHYNFRALHLEWARLAGDATRNTAIQKFAEQNPDNAWVEREWVIYYIERKDWDRAQQHLDNALTLEPNFPYNHFLQGRLALNRGNRAAARAGALQAVRLSVDCEGAIDFLLNACDNPAEQRQTLHIVMEEVARQVNLGDGILACGPHLGRLLGREEQKKILETLHRERPDLWQCWALLIDFHLQQQQLDDALRLATEAEERFPELPRIYWQRYLVHKARNEKAETRATLERALAIHPRSGYLERELAWVVRDEGDRAAARTLLQRAIFHNPLDYLNHGYLAELDLNEQNLSATLTGIERSLQLEPHYPWGRQVLLQLQDQAGRFQAALDFLRGEIARRPGYFWPIMNLAAALARKEIWPECLGALEQALIISPLHPEALELQMLALYRLGRTVEALQIAENPRIPYNVLSQLRIAAAQIQLQQGKKAEALSLLEKAHQEDPGNSEVCKTLTDWLSDLEQWKNALPKARRYVELEPQTAEAHAALGRILLKLGQKAEAETAFETAWRFNSGNRFAAYQLLLLRMALPDPQPANALVEKLRAHPGGDFALRCEVELRVQQGRLNEAWRALATLAATPLTLTGQFEQAWNKLVATARSRSEKKNLYDKLRSLLEQTPQAKVAAGQSLASLAEARQQLGALIRWAAPRAKNSPAAAEALRLGLEQYAAKKRRFLVQGYIWWYRRILRSDDWLWGSAGYSLLTVKARGWFRWWMADWPQRANIKSWMLNNVALEEARRGRWQRLQAVVTRMQAMEPDHTLPHLLSFHGLVVEDRETAHALLLRCQTTPETADVRHYEILRLLVVVRLRTVSAGQLSAEERAKLYRDFETAHYKASFHKVRCFWVSLRCLSALCQQEAPGPKRAFLWLRGLLAALHFP